LSVGPSVMVTASTLFHRYWHQVSLSKIDVWSVAMASTLVATKLEEQPKTLYQIITAYAKIYAQRLILDGLCPNRIRFILESSPHDLGSFLVTLRNSEWWSNFFQSSTTQQQQKQKQQLQFIYNQPMNKTGPVYQEWYTVITRTEQLLLRELGFTLYWIPDNHPHKFLLYFCQVLEWGGEKDVTDSDKQQQQPADTMQRRLVQSAWNYCNDACCYLDLTLRYSAEVIACSAILCTAHEMGGTTTGSLVSLLLPHEHLSKPWWQILIGSDKGQELVDSANAMAGLVHLRQRVEEDDSKDNDVNTIDESDNGNGDVVDWLCAKYGFVRSLMPPTSDYETSFNDPNSFLWEYQKEVTEKEFLNNGSST
jgi:cyclin L